MKRVINNSKVAMLAAMFAMVFTFNACSGDDGSDGKDGKDGAGGCTLEGNKLTCGTQTITFSDGEDGATGLKGDKGETGADGPKGDKGDKGEAGGKGDPGIPCTIDDDGKGPAIITCGDKTILIPICGGKIYSHAEEVCDNNNNLYDIVEIGTQTWMAGDLKGGTANKFTWAEAMAGVCPSGWSLPSKADFDAFLISGETEKWDVVSSDEWWSSTEFSEARANTLLYDVVSFSVNSSTRTDKRSVRCLKD